MKDTETSKLVPDLRDLVLKKQLPERVCIKTYLSWGEFPVWSEEAQKAGIRPVGLKLIVQNRKISKYAYKPNTKGISNFIKEKMFLTWKEHEIDREIRKRELQEQAKELGGEVKFEMDVI